MDTAVEHQVLASHYDDTFFHPNVCHVCKFLRKENMIRCDCGMLSYCSEEHMKMDREGFEENIGHGEICNIIKRMVRRGSMRIFPGGEYYEWIKQKYTYMQIVEEKLHRKIMPYERRMLLSIRYCWICYKDTELKTCKECYSVDFCEEHYRKISRSNDHQCAQIKQWLFLEIKATNIYPIPQWRTFHNFPNQGNVKDMDEFFEEYVVHVRNDGVNWLDIIYSDYLSGPLTAYDVIQKMKLLNYVRSKNIYVIHILEALNMDKEYLPYWEIFLHIFRRPLKLIIIMIGQKLTPDLANTTGKFQTCREKCIPLGHELHFQYHHMTYRKYMGSGLYKKPDMIIGFQITGRIHETLALTTIASLQSPYCQIILTAKSEVCAVELKELMNSFINTLGKHKQPVMERNKFKSYKPYRDSVGYIFYRNEYRIISHKLE